MERGNDKYGFDPRFATCQWMVENLDYLQTYIPRSYPRALVQEDIYSQPLFYVAMFFGLFGVAAVVMTALFIYRRRDRQAVKYAQVEFLFLVLWGLFLVALAAIVMSFEPVNAVHCIIQEWMLFLGYTLALVPLIVKVAAINRRKLSLLLLLCYEAYALSSCWHYFHHVPVRLCRTGWLHRPSIACPIRQA